MPYKDPKRNLEKRRAYKARIIAQCKAYVLEYLKQHPCGDCGNSNPVVLDLHHRDSEVKRASISDMITRIHLSLNAVIKEIQKCDVLCANCHRIRHATEYAHGWRN